MVVALCLAAVLVAFVFIWRGMDVRVVLLITALTIGVFSGEPGTVFRKTAETLADGKFLLPICSAMGFAHVVRETGCVSALVELLLRPLSGARRLVRPGSATAAWIVNMAIPSQTSTLAAVGPLAVPLSSRAGLDGRAATPWLVFGASVAGALLNPGLAEVVTVAKSAGLAPSAVVVPLAPAVCAAFVTGCLVLFTLEKRTHHGNTIVATAPSQESGERPHPLKAVLPPLPVALLVLGHPSLPTHAPLSRLMPEGLEVFTVMLAGTTLTVLLGTRERRAALAALFDGMGYAFTHVITIIAVSAGTAKALEVAGVLGAFVTVASGHAAATFALAFAFAFALAVVSGSGSASSVALVTAFAPRASELGVDTLALGGVILFAAEAGRTTSPVAAVLLFGSQLTGVAPRTLALRLALPCLAAGAAGALYCGFRIG